jgi:hypothetical protein
MLSALKKWWFGVSFSEPLFYGEWDGKSGVFNRSGKRLKTYHDLAEGADPVSNYIIAHASDWLTFRTGYANYPQPEGEAIIRHLPTFTILAFWDRSGEDTRWNNFSLFALPPETKDIDAIDEAKRLFPMIFTRFTFPIKVRN